MNCIIPYTKEIPFNSKIKEITSISLEHEMSINEGEILGNFIISGEYKAHELSVNKESFEHVLPFSIDLTERVIADTIKFNITDFTYEILNDSTLKVIIEFSVIADEKEEEIAGEIEDVFQLPDEKLEEEIIDLAEREELNETLQKEEDDLVEVSKENEEREETEISDIVEIIPEKEKKVIEINEEKERNVANIEMVNETVSKAVDTYKTYHIHIVKEQETLESICEKYKSSKDTLLEYNDLNEIVPGDKLIIPEDD